MSRALDRRMKALETALCASSKDPWASILRELPDAGLEALRDLMTTYASNPTDSTVMAAGCAGILKDFAPSSATLERWLQAVEMTAR